MWGAAGTCAHRPLAAANWQCCASVAGALGVAIVFKTEEERVDAEETLRLIEAEGNCKGFALMTDVKTQKVRSGMQT